VKEREGLTELERLIWVASKYETLLFVAMIFLMSFWVDHLGHDQSADGWFDLQ